MPVQKEREDEEPIIGEDFGDNIDEGTFEQILEMDDDPDDRAFSKSLVFDFFDQAKQTFDSMEKALEERDLTTLSEKGHFLKGSSATLGLTKIKDSCEKIQNYGKNKDADGQNDIPDDDLCLRKIKATLDTVRKEFEDVEIILTKFYEH